MKKHAYKARRRSAGILPLLADYRDGRFGSMPWRTVRVFRTLKAADIAEHRWLSDRYMTVGQGHCRRIARTSRRLQARILPVLDVRMELEQDALDDDGARFLDF